MEVGVLSVAFFVRFHLRKWWDDATVTEDNDVFQTLDLPAKKKNYIGKKDLVSTWESWSESTKMASKT